MPRVMMKVDGIAWKEVKSFARSGPNDTHYIVQTDGNKTTVTFGDGVQGAKPPSGSDVEATYRAGSGTTGEIRVSYRAVAEPTPDRALRIAICNRTHAISFEGNG